MSKSRATRTDAEATTSARAAAQAGDPIPNATIVELALEGWLQSRMELDRSLLQLAGAGIGLIVTLLTTVGVNSRVQWIAAGGCVATFVAVIVLTLLIFRQNANYCMRVAKGATDDDLWLVWMDRGAMIFFIAGLAFAIALGVTINGGQHVPQEHVMKENRSSAAPEQKEIRSLNGLGSLVRKPIVDTTKPPSQPAEAKPASSPPQTTSKQP